MSKEGMVTSLKERSSYYSYFLGQNMLYFLVIQFAMIYYTDYAGISAAVIGTIFLIARVGDAAIDPIFGVIIDKAHLKGGKFKPWVNLAAILLPVITILVFLTPQISMDWRIIYVGITYLLWGLIYSLSDVPNFALSTVMSNNLKERNTMLANGRLFAIIAILIISSAAISGAQGIGWGPTAIIVAVVSCILMTFSRFNIKERFRVESQNITIKKIISYMAHNNYLLIYYLSLTILFALNTGQSAVNYFIIYNLGNASLIPFLTLLTVIPMIISAMVLPRIVARFGKIKVTIITLICTTALSCAYFFIGYQNLAEVCAMAVICGFFNAIHLVLSPMFTSDCIEFATWKSGGERAEGITFAVQTFTMKFGQALNASIVGFILAAINYVPSGQQAAGTLTGIFSMITLIPAAGSLLMLIIFGLFYKLRETDVDRMMKEVSARSKEA